MGLTVAEAARQLGISDGTYSQYENGRERGSGNPKEPNRALDLACSAIAFGLPPYSELKGEVAAQLAALEAAASESEKIQAARALVAAADRLQAR